MLFPSTYGVFISKNGAGASAPAPFLLPHSHCVASALGSSSRPFWPGSRRCVVRKTGSGPAVASRRAQAAACNDEKTAKAAQNRSKRALPHPRGGKSVRPRSASTSASAGRISKQWEARPSIFFCTSGADSWSERSQRRKCVENSAIALIPRPRWKTRSFSKISRKYRLPKVLCCLCSA